MDVLPLKTFVFKEDKTFWRSSQKPDFNYNYNILFVLYADFAAALQK